MLIKTNTFQKNLALFLVPLMIPLLILGTFSIVITRRYIRKEINKSNTSTLLQTKNNIELIFDELDSLNLHLGTNPEIVLSLKQLFDSTDPRVSYEEYRSLTTISNFIDAPANARPYIHSIYVYLDNDQQRILTTIDGLTTVDSFFDKTWFQSYLNHKFEDRQFWSDARKIKNYSFEKSPTPVWSIYRKIYSTSGYQQSIGVIVLNIYTNYLEHFITPSEVQPSQALLITDQFNNIIFSNDSAEHLDKAWLNDFLSSNNQTSMKYVEASYAISQLFSEKYQLRYISIIPLNVLYRVPSYLQSLTLLLLLISFALGLIITYYLTKKNYRQVKDIIDTIESVEHGLVQPQLPSKINNEYSYITHTILKQYIGEKYLKIQLSERKYHLQVMELLALQSQINPHFLFNTLETIKWKIFQLTKKPNPATVMLEELAEILHYSLKAPDQKVTLAEEIHHTKNYLRIQKIRYREKFSIMWEYNEDVNPLPIIRLVFQPLLENCIYHGIKEKSDPSVIKIKIRHLDPCLKISIIDNGLGIKPERLKEIRTNLMNDHHASDNIGLSNTNKRLILTYGKTAGLHINSKFGFGTVVYFQIPLADNF